MKKIITVVIIIIRNKEGKYLMSLRVANDPEDKGYLGYWHIPGGGWQKGETMEQTALREAKEELGLEIEVIKKLPRIFDSQRNDWQGKLNCFLCKFVDPNQQIVLNEEASEYKWFLPKEIRDLKSFSSSYDIILEAEKLFNQLSVEERT